MMIVKFITTLICTFSIFYSVAQVQLDTLGTSLKDVNLVHSALSEDGQEFYTITRSSYLPFYRILRFDKDLQIIDTVVFSAYRQNDPVITLLLNFKGKPYTLMGNTLQNNRRMNLQLLEQNNLTDSFYISVDTLKYFGIYDAYQVNDNTLRLFVNSYGSDYTTYRASYIYDLDSTFQIKQIHKINPDRTPGSGKVIKSVCEVNDTLWHVFFTDELYAYNPTIKKQLFSKYLEGRTLSYYNLNDSTYLGFGISTVLGIPRLRATSQSALGFYTIDQNGNAIDTVSFNTHSHYVPAANYVEYSDESANFRNTVFYDPNNIIMASAYTYFPEGNLPQEDGFIILKTDIYGNEKWRFTIGGDVKITNLTSMLNTPDKGCILTGSFSPDRNNIWHRNTILIKLGPDGTISNVELDAPQTVISLYPNPVQDKLYYSYLPEARGTYSLQIIDMQGRQVMEHTIQQEAQHIPVHLNDGFYLYHLKDENGKVMQVGKLKVQN